VTPRHRVQHGYSIQSIGNKYIKLRNFILWTLWQTVTRFAVNLYFKISNQSKGTSWDHRVSFFEPRSKKLLYHVYLWKSSKNSYLYQDTMWPYFMLFIVWNIRRGIVT